MKILGWAVFALFAVFVGVYPFAYLLIDMSKGLLASKSHELLQNQVWQLAFYSHIFPGAIALTIGWSQFSKRIRRRYVRVHRTIGKIYLLAVIISGVAGFYIALFATGGYITVFGFGGLAFAWLFTTITAYRKILEKDFDQHEYWMIRSYAVCFAAVTLRIWLPLFQFGFGMEFLFAYRIIAWLCWVPNLIVAERIVRKLQSSREKLKIKRAVEA